jgi:hypothetical protein
MKQSFLFKRGNYWYIQYFDETENRKKKYQLIVKPKLMLSDTSLIIRTNLNPHQKQTILLLKSSQYYIKTTLE